MPSRSSDSGISRSRWLGALDPRRTRDGTVGHGGQVSDGSGGRNPASGHHSADPSAIDTDRSQSLIRRGRHIGINPSHLTGVFMKLLQSLVCVLAVSGLAFGCSLAQRAMPGTMSDANVLEVMNTIDRSEI